MRIPPPGCAGLFTSSKRAARRLAAGRVGLLCALGRAAGRMGLLCTLGLAAVQVSGAGSPLRLTLSAEAEQRRALIQDGPLTRSAATCGTRLTYDDQLHLQGVADVRWRGDHVLPERDRVILAEGYVGLAVGPAEIVLGRQQIRWGRLDSLRPTDVFRRRDLIVPLEDLDEPLWAARLDLYTGAATLEAVSVAQFEPDILSFDERNPWCLFPDSVTLPGWGSLPADIEEGGRIAPEEGWASAEHGLRLDVHAGGWDLGTCVGWVHDRLPTFAVPAESLLTASGHARVRVDLAYARLTVAGVDLARALGPGTLRAEAARTWPEEAHGHEAELPYVRAGIGIDRSFPWLGAGRDLTLLLQYVYDEGWTEAGSLGIAGYRHLFRHGGLARLRIEPGPGTRFDVETLLDLEGRDRFAKIEFDWGHASGFGFRAGVLLVDGGSGGLLGRFRDNDEVRLLVRYAWSTGAR